MSITLDKAITALNDANYKTLDGLKQLVNLVSVEVPPCVRIVVASNFKRNVKFEIGHEKI